MAEPVQRPVIEDLEAGSHAAVSTTGTHVMALAAGAVAIVALVASIVTGATIIPIASLSEGDRTTATITAPPSAVAFDREGAWITAPPARATYLVAQASPEWVVIGSANPGVAQVPLLVSRGSCQLPARSPMEVVYRMFDLTVSGPTAFSECWTPGKAPKDPVLTSYIRARAPTSMTTESVAMRFTDGQLFATVAIRGWWQRQPPMGWANGEARWVLMRQQPGGAWTIDAIVESQPN